MQTLSPPTPRKIQPPLIPVIDVIFNLLIFFMLTPNVSAGDGYLTTNLPTNSGPVGGKPQDTTQFRLRITLQDVGPNGQIVEGKNEYCSIIVEDHDFGSNFDALQAFLDAKRQQGLPITTPILLAPTMGCYHEWVVRAFDAAVAARFTNIQFAVPYE